MKITLLAEEWTQSTKGGHSTLNRQLAIELAKQPNVEVSILITKCSPADKNDAQTHNIKVFEPEELLGLEPVLWLAFPPTEFSTDFIIGHGTKLGGIGMVIKKKTGCQWIHLVQSNAEETAMHKNYPGAISKGQKEYETEVDLCKNADMVVTVGHKLDECFKSALHHCKKAIFSLIPGIFDEFKNNHQDFRSSRKFEILVFGRGNTEDFELKGLHVAAKAVADLNDPTYILKVVGAPEGKQDELAEKLVRHGISPNQLKVRSCKEINKLAELFLEVDLVLMPSGTEAFGLIALEALSAGLPVLVTHNSGLAEALEKVPLGSSCIVYTEADWAEAIKKVRKNLELRLEEAKILCEKYEEKYPWKNQCAALVEKLESMCPGHVGEKQREIQDKNDSCSPAQKRLADSVVELQWDLSNKDSYPRGKRQKVDSEEDKDRKDDPKEMEQEEVFSRQEPSTTSGQNAEVAHPQDELNIKVEVDALKPAEPSTHTTTPDSALDSADCPVFQHQEASALPVILEGIQPGGAEVHPVYTSFPKAEDVLSLIAANYIVTTPPQCKNDHCEFIEYMQEMRLAITGVHSGSLVITVKCNSRLTLEELWEDYSSGYLGKEVQKCFATEEILKELNLGELKLKTTIGQDEYKACKVYFEKNPVPTESPQKQKQLKKCEQNVEMNKEVKQGSPTYYEPEVLGSDIGEAWIKLGRRLEIDDARLEEINNKDLALFEKGYHMLGEWKQERGSAATYKVLCQALQHRLVNRQDLAEEHCYEQQ